MRAVPRASGLHFINVYVFELVGCADGELLHRTSCLRRPCVPDVTGGHLVVTRRIGEMISIGDDIQVTVTQIRERSVRLAIKAPKDCPITREEANAARVPAPRDGPDPRA